jgi:hypothetical protein
VFLKVVSSETLHINDLFEIALLSPTQLSFINFTIEQLKLRVDKLMTCLASSPSLTIALGI